MQPILDMLWAAVAPNLGEILLSVVGLVFLALRDREAAYARLMKAIERAVGGAVAAYSNPDRTDVTSEEEAVNLAVDQISARVPGALKKIKPADLAGVVADEVRDRLWGHGQ
jgi:hypothetical protein